MKTPLRFLGGLAVATLAFAEPAGGGGETDAARTEVAAAEQGFADAMARRDFDAFAAFVADDAVFLNGNRPLRGKAAILAHWKRFFEGPSAPFSWRPELVEVNGRGDLAQSDGPVFAPDGNQVSRFYSTWRREGPGVWRVVFDNGYEAPLKR